MIKLRILTKHHIVTRQMKWDYVATPFELELYPTIVVVHEDVFLSNMGCLWRPGDGILRPNLLQMTF